MASTANTSTGAVTAEASRWPQLIFGVACMVAASNIQYSWTQFVPEIQKAHGWERAAIQTAFSIFVVVQTWSTPFIGHFIDRYGPRVLVLLGGVGTRQLHVQLEKADLLVARRQFAAQMRHMRVGGCERIGQP